MQDYSLYVVTDEELSYGRTHREIAEQAVRGGATVIQLRDKTRSAHDLFQIAREIAEVTRRAGVLSIVNDRLDIALGAGADGVHLGQDDLPIAVARRLAPPPFLIGISIHSIAQAEEAKRQGADYIAVSPVFETNSKSDAGPGHGLRMLSEVVHLVQIPVIGIGGINHTNLHHLFDAGASGIAVISAIVSAPDISAAARAMKEQILSLTLHS
ncbi:MAG: thiamine phosphate synthase [Methanomicrobiales archaeon]|nr:thiamine phosphate synthase [Methanomicrobiales archaeon]